jgi:hypothetical protein
MRPLVTQRVTATVLVEEFTADLPVIDEPRSLW